jgi:hypothetical protein
MGAASFIFLIGFLFSAGGSWYLTKDHYQGKIAILELSYKTAVVEGLKANAKLTQEYEEKRNKEAQSWENEKEILISWTKSANQKVEKYVKDGQSSCITFGALRLLDGEIRGIDPERLPLPAGKSNFSCANISSTLFHRRLLEGLGSCKLNAAQLNALSLSVRRK